MHDKNYIVGECVIVEYISDSGIGAYVNPNSGRYLKCVAIKRKA